MTATELQESLPLFSSPLPETAPSREIRVPTLLAVGDHDNIACGPPDGLRCTRKAVAAFEAPYYSPEAQMRVVLVRKTGHDLQLHKSAPKADDRILEWLDAL